MKRRFMLDQPHVKAKIIGIILIAIGIVFLLNSTSLYIKIGFTSILIGIFMIFMVTERSVPQKISNAQIEGNLGIVKSITKELNLAGNAVFIPKSDILTEERIFIPLNNSDVALPEIDDDFVFSTGTDGKSLGISIPPSGLKLLQEVEKEADFENAGRENIEEKLQAFVGMDILKSVSFTKEQDSWKLELEKPVFCTNDPSICTKYPCPTCSAVLTAITKASKKEIWINDTTHNGKKMAFHLKMRE
ncbi:MAG: hypothetical protein KAW47_11245 [Thermoplasmatales archaeon]|nr:hypothetical protein [Thermoplasmatales archaeon]